MDCGGRSGPGRFRDWDRRGMGGRVARTRWVANTDGQELAVGASEVCRRGALGYSGLLFLKNLPA